MILEYFGEDPDSASVATGDCCDVCSLTTQDESDYKEQLQVVTKATAELSGTGEKKVGGIRACRTSSIHYRYNDLQFIIDCRVDKGVSE